MDFKSMLAQARAESRGSVEARTPKDQKLLSLLGRKVIPLQPRSSCNECKSVPAGSASASASASTSSSSSSISHPICEDEALQSYMSLSLTLSPPVRYDISQYQVGHIPEVYVIPDFVSFDEEEQIIKLSQSCPPSSWVHLKRRSLQNWGGSPCPEGMIQEPLPSWTRTLIDRLTASGAFDAEHGTPNHVLLNQYLPAQGIMPHKDGPLYYPRVAILSAGSHTIMHFYRQLADWKADRPAMSVFLPPRSLLIFTKELYHDLFHCIQEVEEDEITDSVINSAQCNVKIGERYARGTRLSVTMRVAPVRLGQEGKAPKDPDEAKS